MSVSNIFISGYYGKVWTTTLSTMQYYNANIDASQIVAAQTLTSVAANTMKNAINLIDANLDIQQTYSNYLLLTEAFAVPVVIDPDSTSFINNRLAGMLAFAGVTNKFQLPISLPSATIPQGLPPIPDPQYLEYIITFADEASPSGLTAGNFVEQAFICANSWAVLANALMTSGQNFSGTALQMVVYMQQASTIIAQNLNSASIIPKQNLASAWNQLVAVPTYLALASFTGNDPSSLQSQNLSTAKYSLGVVLQSLNQALVTLRQQVTGAVLTTTIRQNESLLDVAARTLGNFESWVLIAAINNLLPPYITPTATATTAAPGQQIFLPTTGTVQTPGNIPVYTINYLGVDLYYGPLQQDMSTWAGDFSTIAGYNNLSFSLGRRLQTTLGTLVFHTSFGSRIPPLIGSVETINELNVITAYAQSAILSDPRVASTTVSAVQYVNYAIGVQANVTPNGMSTNSVSAVNVNEVIG